MRTRQARHQRISDPLDESAPIAADRPDPERLAESAEVQRRVASALEDLTPLERAAFALRHYEGRSIDEISRTLGLGTSAAKHAVFRAVKKLRIALAPLRAPDVGRTLDLMPFGNSVRAES
jgi:RNA polymerase sigma-70 factor (ECF subfamily)